MAQIQSVTSQSPAVKRVLTRFWHWCELIKVEHTVFALPFALSGLILAGKHLPALSTLFWTVLAFAGARAAAMSLNRAIDAEIDQKNPRTRTRAIPQGKIKKSSATWFAVISFAVMILAAYHLPPICLQLAPIAVVWLSLYSLSKRFTWLCHFFLGIALGGASLGGWIASGADLVQPAPWILALSVTTWVAGFDIIYACLDIDFDRQEKLFSLPAKFGVSNALITSSALHVVTVAALIYLGGLLQLGLTYWIGVFVAGLALVWEHNLVRPGDLSKANAAFFNANGLVSILVFLAIFLDKILRS